jgi:UDP-N-acetylglucosamine diphosphorylase/glucosamine-1-phosphate N-acetyltransferase
VTVGGFQTTAQLVLLETEPWRFGPLIPIRSVPELRVGASTLLERAERIRPEGGEPIVVVTRDHLRELLEERYGSTVSADPDSIESERVLIVDASFLVDERLPGIIGSIDSVGKAVLSEGSLVAALVGREQLLRSLEGLDLSLGLERVEVLRNLSPSIGERLDAGRLRRLGSAWDLIPMTEELLKGDLERTVDGQVLGELDESVRVIGDRSRLHLGRGSTVEPFVTIDLRKGPVFIGEGSTVMSNSRISGPCFVGRGSVVFPGSFTGSSYIGEVSRVGGEVESSVIAGYSNKRHYGYLGHSYVGEWVNLGAGTTVSNLKNTYGTVRVRMGEGVVDTGRTFLGPLVGDHVKSAIGTLVFSGKAIGAFSHLYGTVTDDVPPFTIHARPLVRDLYELTLESALETARRMMSRRGISPSQAFERAVRIAFELTAEERRAAGVKGERFGFT